MGLAHMEEPVGVHVEWLAAQLGIPVDAFADYAARPQTMTDHALKLATTLGLRPPSNADLPFMIEAAAQSAWSTESGPADCRRRHRSAGDRKDHSPGVGGRRAHRHCRAGSGTQAGCRCFAGGPSPGATS
jgi:hypothetical protein